MRNFPNPDPRAAIQHIDDRYLMPLIGDCMLVPSARAQRPGWGVADGRTVSRDQCPAYFHAVGAAGSSVALPDNTSIAPSGLTWIVRLK